MRKMAGKCDTNAVGRMSAPVGGSNLGSVVRGTLRVCAALICLSALGLAGHAQTGTIAQLFAFPCAQQTGNCPSGASPDVLIQASDGNFYGAAEFSTIDNSGGGTLFKITPGGQFTRLFTFPAGGGKGSEPATALVEANDGFIYGTTLSGGGADSAGVLFRISKNGGEFEVLHRFCSSANCADGSLPNSLILGQDGNLYGVTQSGGSDNSICIHDGGCGTIFRFTPPSTFTRLFEFDGSTEIGRTPFGLIQGSDGNFYGAGENVFRFTASGEFTVLADFPLFPAPFIIAAADSQLVQASSGALYGALIAYELHQAQFYEIDPSSGGLELLPQIGILGVNFFIGSTIQASDGNLWTAFTQSNATEGGVITMSPETGAVLQNIAFAGTNGSFPDGGVIQGADGKIYGTATQGGTVAKGKVAGGAVWSLDAGLPAPAAVVAAFHPVSGAVGSKVKIRGNGFIGTTAVTFNGVGAAFEVLNTYFITATVPAGAASGPIAVTNLGGTTVSTEQFTVQ